MGTGRTIAYGSPYWQMMAERTIFMARHGSREDFEDPQWVQRAEYPHDPDVSATGIREAQQLARRMARERFSPRTDPASLCRLDLEEDSRRLCFLNDTSHLAADV